MYQSRIRQKKSRSHRTEKNRGLIEPDEGQDYAVVQEMMGNGRLKALCSDGNTRIGRIRGSMRKYAGKVIIEKGDLIVVSFRDFEEDKVDVIAKYTTEEVATVLKNYELSEKLVKALTHSDFNNYGKTSAADDYVMFMNEDDQSTSSKVEPANDLLNESSQESVDIDAI
jgi:translation initiation factor 1A